MVIRKSVPDGIPCLTGAIAVELEQSDFRCLSYMKVFFQCPDIFIKGLPAFRGQ